MNKIAILTDGIFPGKIGGIQKHSFYLSKYLARAGIHVDLYYAEKKGTELKKRLIELYDSKEYKNINLVSIERPRVKYFPGHYIYESYLISSLMHIELRTRPLVDFINWSASTRPRNVSETGRCKIFF